MIDSYIRESMAKNSHTNNSVRKVSGVINYKQAKANVRDIIATLIDNNMGNRDLNPKSFMGYTKEAINDFIDTSPEVEGFVNNDGSLELERLRTHLIADFIQHGKLQPALDSNDISEIQINDFNSIWVEKNGVKEPYIDSATGQRVKFSDVEEYSHFVNQLLMEDTKKITSEDALIDAITLDGFRVAAQGSGATVADKEGKYKHKPTCVTIRKQRDKKFTAKELVESQCMSNNMGKLLEIIPSAKLTSFIGGATGSGKTVILQVLADNCPDDMRVAALGNPAELKLRRRQTYGEDEGVILNNVVHLEAREYASLDKAPREFPTIDNCNRALLRMTPEVEIVEEVRSRDEVEFVVDAAQTGHFFLTSFHAESVTGLLSRFVSLYIAQTQGIDRNSAVDIIADFLKIVVIREKMPDSTRKITEICEIDGAYYDEGGVRQFRIRPLYKYIRNTEVLAKTASGSISRSALKRKVVGRHYRVGTISCNLKKELIDAGFDEEIIQFLTKPLQLATKEEGGRQIQVYIPEPEDYVFNPLFID